MKSSFMVTAAVSCSLSVLAASASESPESPSRPLAFSQVNEQLLQNYSRAKEEIKEKLGPIVYLAGTTLTLINGKERDSKDFIRPHYTGLKEVSHITLGTFVLLTNHTDQTLEITTLDRLKDYKSAIEKASTGLEKNESLDLADLKLQKDLVEVTLKFLDKVLAEKHVSQTDLATYVHQTSVTDNGNADRAAASQLETMDQIMTSWRSKMTDKQWENLHVVIVTSHMPRVQLVAYQYFAKLLHQEQEGDRIIVAENNGTTSEEQAIDLLLTHILDRKVATDFFHDPWRMHRDLLSDGARKWLDMHSLAASKPRN